MAKKQSGQEQTGVPVVMMARADIHRTPYFISGTIRTASKKIGDLVKTIELGTYVEGETLPVSQGGGTVSKEMATYYVTPAYAAHICGIAPLPGLDSNNTPLRIPIAYFLNENDLAQARASVEGT